MTKFNSKYANDSNESIGLMFIKTYNSWHRFIKKELDSLGITHPQYVILASLNYLSSKNSEVKQIDIANLSDIDVMTVSDILKLLERKDLVERTISKEDSRAKAVKLTTLGSQKTSEATKIVENIDKEFFGKLDSEQNSFLELLKRLS